MRRVWEEWFGDSPPRCQSTEVFRRLLAWRAQAERFGGFPPLGYDILNRKLSVNETEAATVRLIYDRFLELRSIRALATDLRHRMIVSKQWKTRHGVMRGSNAFSRGALYHLLRNRLYLGQIAHKGEVHTGEHPAIVTEELWQRV